MNERLVILSVAVLTLFITFVMIAGDNPRAPGPRRR